MGNLAILAKTKGYQVSGSDDAIYEPMKSQLDAHEIEVTSFSDWNTDHCDSYLVGNIMKRGMPIIEKLISQGKTLWSGPEWLSKHILYNRRVIVVAGTHGKTSTTALIAWIMQQAGHDIGYLIGGVPCDLPSPVHLGSSPWFVIEGDEYDTAYFDKRPKLMHYRPWLLLLNNCEFDHADIYRDLEAIQLQFQYAMRLVPPQGSIITHAQDQSISNLVRDYHWCHWWLTDKDLAVQSTDSKLAIAYQSQRCVIEGFDKSRHHFANVKLALLTCLTTGLSLQSLPDLSNYQGVKRRMELVYDKESTQIYEDFAHHPSAIQASYDSISQKKDIQIDVVIECGSNTMKLGVHDLALVKVLEGMKRVALLNAPKALKQKVLPLTHVDCFDGDVAADWFQKGRTTVVMSNRSTDWLHSLIQKRPVLN